MSSAKLICAGVKSVVKELSGHEIDNFVKPCFAQSNPPVNRCLLLCAKLHVWKTSAVVERDKESNRVLTIFAFFVVSLFLTPALRTYCNPRHFSITKFIYCHLRGCCQTHHVILQMNTSSIPGRWELGSSTCMLT